MNKDQTLSYNKHYSKERLRIITFLELNCQDLDRTEATYLVQRFYHLRPDRAHDIVKVYYESRAKLNGGKNE